MAGRIAEWDARLESGGRVTFRQNPIVLVLVLLTCLLVALGFLDALVADGPSLRALLGVAAFGLVGLLTGWRLASARPALTVSAEGVRARRGPLVPFDHLESVTTRGRNLTLDYLPLPEEQLGPRQRRSGRKQLYAALTPFGARVGDVAYWLLLRKGGPDARIDVSGGGGRLPQVYRLAEKRFWER